jgi:tRNA(fMet)-specific endonuclease VapC
MDSILLDTNIVSYLVKGDTRGARYREDLDGRRLCISFITVGELRLGMALKGWGKPKRERVEQTIRSYVVIPFDDQVATEWARIGTSAIRAGRNQVDRSDWWIAACAVRHDLALVTHNAKDFAGIDNLRVVTRPDVL